MDNHLLTHVENVRSGDVKQKYMDAKELIIVFDFAAL
jgi:hypothetical protein